MKVSEWLSFNAIEKVLEMALIGAVILNISGSMIWFLVIAGIKLGMAILDTFAADAVEDLETKKAHSSGN